MKFKRIRPEISPLDAVHTVSTQKSLSSVGFRSLSTSSVVLLRVCCTTRQLFAAQLIT